MNKGFFVIFISLPLISMSHLAKTVSTLRTLSRTRTLSSVTFQLHEYARDRASLEKLKELIGKVDVNIRDSKGRTALMMAAFGNPSLLGSNVEAIRLLLILGADRRLKCNMGLTACDYAEFTLIWRNFISFDTERGVMNEDAFDSYLEAIKLLE
ncbi:hypothetical protein A3F66_06595 [candidate division TM6 bacterium RIFCSPHIGHO2_12_FULL_32_22]|nr:MAG: hypothetical protein A3F66_06595 [candidate division TM6 bacterium RIFCSPHIGHO2_12_FULL_32_22]